FICRECLDLLCQKAAMRVVTIRARHRTLGKAVCMWPLKRRPDICMTGHALLIDPFRLSSYQTFRLRLMHPVTTRAGDPASCMAALDPSHVSWLIAMAGEATFIALCRTKLCRVHDVVCRPALHVSARRSVA